MKTFLKILITLTLGILLLYAVIMLLTYYQYNFSPEFSNKKPIENNL